MQTPEIRILEAKEAHSEVFQHLNISDSDLAGILHGKNHEQKLEWVTSHFRSILQPLGFTGSHVSQIVVNADWDKKLAWIEQNFTGILQPLGFSQSHTSQIIRGKGWKEKMEWIEVMFQSSGLTPKEAQKILVKKNWKEVLD